MNFLAHAYLSGDDPDILAGNIMADFVKGKAISAYSPAIQKGIYMHRKIDLFTDTHPAVKECRKLFYPAIRHYAMVIVDVVFDHFLGKNWKHYHPQPLPEYTQQVYELLAGYEPLFPERFRFVFPRMRAHDWLLSYASEEGLSGSFYGLSHRSPAFTFPQETMELFRLHSIRLEHHFMQFFPELVAHCQETE